jgi:hypothetical protein
MGKGQADVKSQGAGGAIGQNTGQGAVLPGQIVGQVGQGANSRGISTGQGSTQFETVSGQGANLSGEILQGLGAAASAVMSGEKNKGEQLVQEAGGGD